MSAEYPEHYLEEPSEEVMDALKARRLRAEADPLEIGHQLTWFGPNLEQDVIPPLDYPHHRSPSPNPLRPFHSRLLDPNEGVSAQPWTLTLVEPLSTGVMKRSQVWRAEASRTNDQSSKFFVVVKLRQESLSPLPYGRSVPEADNWNWLTTRYLVKREAQVYRLAKDLQGSDLPICYGFYKFQIPTGEEMVGLALEDLNENRGGVNLRTYIEREAKSDRLNFQAIDNIMCSALQLQNRLHSFEIANMLHRLDKFVHLRATNPYKGSPTLVGVGFGVSSTRTRLDREQEETERVNPERACPRDYWRWERMDQDQLFGSMLCLFATGDREYEHLATGWNEKYDHLATEWRKLERERGQLHFLCDQQTIYTESSEEAEAEDPDAEELDRLLAELTEG